MKLPRLIVLAIFFGGILLGVLLAGIAVACANEVLVYVAIGILCASAAFHMIFYRCPKCKRYLGKSWGSYCPYCGEDVD